MQSFEINKILLIFNKEEIEKLLSIENISDQVQVLLKIRGLRQQGRILEALDIINNLNSEKENGKSDLIRLFIMAERLIILLKSQIYKNLDEEIDKLKSLYEELELDQNIENLFLHQYYLILGAFNYYSINLNLSVENYKHALEYGRKLEQPELICSALYSIGGIHNIIHETELALEYINEGMLLAKQFQLHYLVSRFKKTKANLEYSSGNISTALEIYEELKSDQLIRNNPRDFASIQNGLGIFYLDLGKLKQALDAFYEYRNVAKNDLNDPWEMACADTNIALVYKKVGRLENSLEYNKEALELLKESGTELNVINCLGIISDTYLELGQIEYAKSYLEDAINRSEKLEIKKYKNKKLASCYSKLGKLYFYQREIDSALEAYNKSISYQEDIENIKSLRVRAYVLYSLIYIKSQELENQEVDIYIKQLQDLTELVDDLVINQWYKLATALFNLKKDPINSLYDVKMTLEELESETLMDFQIKYLTIVLLCEIYYKSAKINSKKGDIVKMFQKMDDLEQVLKSQEMKILLVNYHLLRSYLHLEMLEFTLADDHLRQAYVIAKELQIEKIITYVENRIKNFDSKVKEVRNLDFTTLPSEGDLSFQSETDEYWTKLKADLRPIKPNEIMEVNNYSYFLHPVRLAIMKLLEQSSKLIRADLQKQLKQSSGAFKSHLDTLKAKGLIEIEYDFIEEKPRQVIYITQSGRSQFSLFCEILEVVL